MPAGTSPDDASRHDAPLRDATDLPVDPRALLAWLVTLVLGALAGPVLGEYQFTALFAVIAGVLTGLLLGEVCVGLARTRSIPSGVVTAVATAGGLVLAGWLSTSKGVDTYPATAWLSAVLGAAAGWLRAGPWMGRSRRRRVSASE